MRISRLLIAATAVAAACSQAKPEPPEIIPQPAEITVNDGSFKVAGASFTIGENVPAEALKAIGAFRDNLETVTGTKTGDKAGFSFLLNENLGPEAYALKVTPEGATVEAADFNGFFYAIQSIKQMLPVEIYGNAPAKAAWSLPCVDIMDSPRFAYRGLLMDCCRHFFPVEEVKKVLDLMSIHKMNRLHWHLTEDQGWRIQIDKYPRLTEIGAWRKETAFHSWIGNGIPHGGFYTKDDIREVVEYARRRCVTVIPEVEIPGHSTAAIAAYPELSCFPERSYEVETRWGIWKNLYAPTARTFQFLEDVFTELFELFPSPYYHIGGDEAPKDVYRESQYCQDLMKVLGLKDVEELQTFFVKRIGDFLKEHGKTVIGWDEILDGGALEDPIAMSYRGHAPAARGIRRGIRVVLTPNRWCYLDNHQDDQPDDLAQEVFMPLKKVYNYYPAVDSIPDLSKKYIIGYETCLWTEYIPDSEKAEWMAFPRNVAAAEVAWTSRPNKDWESFRMRMPKILRRLDMKHIGYCPVYYEVIFDYDRRLPFPKPMNLELDYPDGVVHYTLDGSEPTADSPVYDGNPFMVDKDAVIKARAFTAKGQPLGKTVTKEFFSNYGK